LLAYFKSDIIQKINQLKVIFMWKIKGKKYLTGYLNIKSNKLSEKYLKNSLTAIVLINLYKKTYEIDYLYNK